MKERKSLYSSISGWGMFLAGVLLLTACADDEIIESPAVTGDGISFSISKAKKTWEPDQTRSAKSKENPTFRCEDPNGGFSIDVTTTDGIDSYKPDQQPQSRGTQITEKNENWGYKVGAYYYIPNQTAPVDYFDENSSGGYSVTTSTETVNTDYYWPPAGSMKFFAVAPANITGFNAPTAENIATPTLTYTIPAVVADQKDIMVAQPATIDLANRTSAQVGLQFEHLLAAVKFVKGDMGLCRLQSIEITGVYGDKTVFTYNNDAWKANPEKTVSYKPAVKANTESLDKLSEITTEGNVMLVSPQDLPEGAKVIVNYYDLLVDANAQKLLTKEVSIKGHKWVAGKTITYKLNINTDFNVTFQDPGTQDAHYVMPYITYDMGSISSAITELEASVEYINNSAQNGEIAKLKMLDKLTTKQSQNFWTEYEYTEGTDTDGNLVYENETYIGGTATLSNIPQKGTIVMFLPENNGETDRDVTLRITGTFNGNKINIDSHTFKQLCPSWNKDGIGVERIEDGITHPYGFKYDRKVTYENTALTIGLGWVRNYVSGVIDNYITDDAGDFITITYGTGVGVTYIDKVVVDYSALNDLNNKTSYDDGLENTINLYNFTGGNDIAQIETDLAPYENQYILWTKYLTKTVNNKGTSQPEDYAAFCALLCNKFFEVKSYVDNNGTQEPHYDVVIAKSDIKWYLPSASEAEKLVETQLDDEGNSITKKVINSDGTESTINAISALDGEYWSSYAVNDNTNAYTYKYSQNKYTADSNKTKTDRMSGKKVRAVRKK